MSRSFISILIIFIIVGATYVLRQRGARESSVKVEDIQMGPIRHSQLSDELLARITAIEGKVAEVYPQTHEQWVEGFQRDMDPEIEIAIWENIASAYQTFTTPRNLSRPAKLEAFGLLLVRSSSADMADSYSKLKHLSLPEAKELISLYSATPQPILYERR
ncbi:MAG: hypothetical protein OJI67_16270 [Prosthecobacter sp.]|nr:hypothetical protein [Prosthecobacter sp.]